MKTEKSMEHENDGDTNCDWCARYSHQWIVTRTGRLGNKRTSRDHPNSSFLEIGHNNEKSPGDLKWLAVTQTPVRNYQLTLMWKLLKEQNNNNNNINNNNNNMAHQNPVSFLENKMHKIIWDFEIPTNHLISARRPDLVIITRIIKKKEKRTSWIVEFAVHNGKERRVLRPCRRTKKGVEYESDGHTNCN